MANMNLGERAVYQKALHSGWWIYEVNTKSWFEPDEFSALINNHGNFRNADFEIRDPFNAVDIADAKIKDMQRRRDEFQRKLMAWCKKNLSKG